VHGFQLLWSGLGDVADAATSAVAVAIAAWLLSLVLVWSGVAKLRSPRLAALSLADFRLVRHPRTWMGWALGGAELAVAAALAVAAGRAGTTVPAVAAAALFAAFAGVIARALAAPHEFSCFCFGPADRPLSVWSMLRALLLAGVAAVVAAHPAPPGDPREVLLAVASAVALLGLVSLAAKVPALLRWNGDPFGLDPRLFESRPT
jgi:methylamine utilization protein MauE